MSVTYFLMLALLIFGFGFVIFWHELGHFLAAKWAGVKVDQFAVGFGQAAVSWRKGLGFRAGSSAKEYERRVVDKIESDEQARPQFREKTDHAINPHSPVFENAAEALGLGETEYRLNWIPLGGYVKMVGQDDMDPAARSESPRAYNNRPIWKRMIIVSAGVIMNMILAVIFFTILFRIGFNVPPALVGGVVPGSPAQRAGLMAGDRVLSINGNETHDFNKMMMTVALLEDGKSVPMVLKGSDGQQRTVSIAPSHQPDEPANFLKFGIEPASELRGLDPKSLPEDWEEKKKHARPELFAIEPGDTITAVNQQTVNSKDISVFEQLVQGSGGKPIELKLRAAGGAERTISVQPLFAEPFDGLPVNFAGLAPRGLIEAVVPKSAADGKLQPGDAVIAYSSSDKPIDWQTGPGPHALRKAINAISEQQQYLNLKVLRNGAAIEVNQLATQSPLENGNRGLGISPGYDFAHAVIGEVLPESSAARAGIQAGATISMVGGKPVQSWFDIFAALRNVDHASVVPIVMQTADGERTADLQLDAADIAQLAQNRFELPLPLHAYDEVRQTKSPVEAAKWGVAETRDLTIQFYLMLRRMFQGSVSPKNAMGPYGIFKYGSAFAQRGIDWLIWFLAMISANLAVVNFLPIPIVDGGLFLFLVLEKVMGRPLSPRTQGIAQIVGLCLIGTVFLFVTYNDIRR